MPDARTRLEIAATLHDIVIRDEGPYVIASARAHPHGLGVAVEIRGNSYVKLPDEIWEGEEATQDLDVVIGWTALV